MRFSSIPCFYNVPEEDDVLVIIQLHAYVAVELYLLDRPGGVHAAFARQNPVALPLTQVHHRLLVRRRRVRLVRIDFVSWKENWLKIARTVRKNLCKEEKTRFGTNFYPYRVLLSSTRALIKNDNDCDKTSTKTGRPKNSDSIAIQLVHQSSPAVLRRQNVTPKQFGSKGRQNALISVQRRC